VNYLRIERPQTPSQLSECQGAGTGCGWCRPMLRKLWEASRQGQDAANAELPTAEDYGAEAICARGEGDAAGRSDSCGFLIWNGD
jgi:bacterioferritin-associated ferredoxin